MRKWKIFNMAALALLFSLASIAQNTEAGSADTSGFMTSGGKIYVVLAVVLTILAGLILYVARLDRKISKMEKEG